MPKVLPGYSGGRLLCRSTKEKGREELAADEDGEEREIRSQITQGVVACIKEKISVHSGDKEAVQRPAGQRVTRSWDCSKIENEELDVSRQEGGQMAAQWEEGQKTGGDRGTKKN